MAHTFILDGVDSSIYNCYVAKSNMFDSASEDVETLVVPGRNGSLHISKKRYNDFSLEFECYIPNSMQTNIDNLRNWLLSKPIARIEDSLRRTEYRTGRFNGEFTVTSSDRQGAAFTLPFLCRPERWLISGETITSFTSDGTMTNPTQYAAKPLIRAYGTGKFVVNGYEITIDDCTTYVDIDCETMNCYEGTINRNDDVIIDEFPVLDSGFNTIDIHTISKIDITPRWWQL